jgi:ribonuclease R
MAEQFESKIIGYLKSGSARPLRPRRLARALDVEESEYHAFRDALRRLMREGRIVLGARGSIVLPTQKQASDRIIGTYRHHRRGFGFVVPTDPAGHEDLFIPEGQNGGAITGDIVSAKITSRGQRDGKALYEGRVMEILQRTHTRFVGTLQRLGGRWVVLPDGNALTEPILTPDAASRNLRAGTKVVVELTTYPDEDQQAQGVITEVLGLAGQKDVDLRSVIIQFNLPEKFPQEVLQQARRAVDAFNATKSWPDRQDLSDLLICTIDPDDAKDYDDAISLQRLRDGRFELGVHIADVAHFIPPGTPMDEEAAERGNSCYFPGFVIPMLPEVLSNGVCSLQEGVPRLCKSVFITFDEDGRPIHSRFANTVIKSACRLRYREAQAIIDNADVVPHPDGPRRIDDYDSRLVSLLRQMDVLAKTIQKRRLAEGQIVLDLPEIELILDADGRVVGTQAEDQSFTHTLIEMFMVEANEAVARLLDSLGVPFLRRVHPEPATDSYERLRHFVNVAGHRLPKILDRKAIQSLLAGVRGRPEAFAINLAVLRSLARAEYSPQPLGHYALASECYCHFTSPIRRYADLTVHRLLDQYIAAVGAGGHRGGRRRKVEIADVVPYDRLVEIGKHISFTERRADDAERELRQVKILELLKDRVGEEYLGVVTGIANFGIFVQLSEYLIDGLIRYEDLMDDWWDVDERGGVVRGQRTGQKIGIGDVVRAIIVTVDVPRRELNLAIAQVLGRGGRAPAAPKTGERKQKDKERRHAGPRGGRFKRRGR